MHDCLIVGGGVVGLSLAYDLAQHGVSVRLVDRDQPGSAASWAGAGILPPANFREGAAAANPLAALSHRLHPIWAAELRERTGIDTGFRRCGGLYFARDAAAADRMSDEVAAWRSRGAEVEPLDADAVKTLTPAVCADGVLAAYRLPEEGQLRNPRHLAALISACENLGVEISAGVEIRNFEIRGDRILAASTGAETLRAGSFCITSGCWSGSLAAALGLNLQIQPVRGQIVLLRRRSPPIDCVVNEQLRYIVPRDDGRVLVGATVEHAGFDCRTTATGVAGLLQFGMSLVPALSEAVVEKTWAGLRPGTPDGAPYLDRIEGLANGFVAAGHYRSGLVLSPGTAVVMSQLMRGETPEIALKPFRADRDAGVR